MADTYDTGFCAECTAQSTDRTPKKISTTNGIGRKFYGSADRCSQCGSVVRTLWFTIAYVPLIPLGSYRYKSLAAAKQVGLSTKWSFFARRCGMNWVQVLITWLVGFALAAAVIAGFVMYDKYYKRR